MMATAPGDSEESFEHLGEIEPASEVAAQAEGDGGDEDVEGEIPLGRMDRLAMNLVAGKSSIDAKIYRDASPRDLYEGRVQWTNSWRRDALFYLFNNNMLLSPLFVHRNHPYRRWTRALVLFLSLALTYMFTTIGLLLPWGVNTLWMFLISPLLLFIWNTYINFLVTCPCARSEWMPAKYKAPVSGIARNLLILNSVTAVICVLIGNKVLAFAMANQNSRALWVVRWIITQVTSLAWTIPADLFVYTITRAMKKPSAPEPGPV